MNSIIISPYTKGVSGTAERVCTADSVSIRFDMNHPAYADGDMFRLYAMSTSHAAEQPYLIGYYEAKGRSGTVSGEFTAKAVSDKSFNICDADTYLVTKYDGDSEEPVAAAFFGLEWNAARFLTADTRGETGTEHKAAQSREKHEKPGNHERCGSLENSGVQDDMAVANAKKILGGMKNGKKISRAKINEYVSGIKKNLAAYEIIGSDTELESDGYEWHRVTGGSGITNLSSVRHILSGRYAAAAVGKAGYYIAGVRKDDPCHIAIGIPECRHVCPMPQLRDCCVFSGGYHIAGVYLAEDGQYFEKYLQNES